MAERAGAGGSNEHADLVGVVRDGYAFDGPCLEMGALVTEDGAVHVDAPVRVPLRMMNRHGLVAGATGTGKTKTLQVLAEQLVGHGVPVFAPDIKGDLSGLAVPGESSSRLEERAVSIGQAWQPASYPVEFFVLGEPDGGVPIRATVTSFGPALLAKVLDLNDVQESSLGLVFHFADKAGLPLLDLADLRAVIQHLVSDEGKQALADLGGLSKQTAGVILRELINFADQGAEVFFGEPEFEIRDLLRTTADGRGVISLLELPSMQDRPALFSTFLMWLLAELFEELPEVGDLDKPKLVFFFDEAHLLFKDASKSLLRAVEQTVRLIRSKGIGVFFVTHTPQDVPEEVLGQLSNRIQHALRAFTPDDAKALRQTVRTYPHSAYDLEEVLTTLGIGEAVVTVMSERGAPTPVAWTRMRAPQSRMAPAPADVMAGAMGASALASKYGTGVDRESAYEMLAARLKQDAGAAAADDLEAAIRRGGGAGVRVDLPDSTTVPAGTGGGLVEDLLGSGAVRSMMRSAGSALGREIVRGIFGTRRRRRR